MKLLYIFVSVLFCNICLSQINNITKVTYKINSSKPQNATSRFKPDNLEFELIFNNDRSLYKIVDKMESDMDPNYKVVSIIHGGNLIYYTDFNKKENLFNVNFLNQTYNINLQYDKYDWQILNESKTINGFKCYKATTTIEKLDKGKNTVIKQHPIVWFTSEIPTRFGPKGLNGLPGLILEGSIDGVYTFYATKITNSNTKEKLIKPDAEIEMNERDFDDLMFNNYKINKEASKPE